MSPDAGDRAGDDVAVIVQVIIDSGDVDIDIRMLFLHAFNADGSAEKAHKAYIRAAALLEEIDAGGR